MFFSGLIYVIIGLVFIAKKGVVIFAVKGLLNITTILFLLAGLSQLLGLSLRKRELINSSSRLLGFLGNMTIVLVLYLKPQIIVSFIPIAFGVYALFSSLVRMLIYLQYKRNKVKGRYFIVLEAIFLGLIGLLIVRNPLRSIIPLSNLIGIFFIMYGFTYLIDGLVEGLGQETKNNFKRRFRINLPVFMVALIPHKIMMKINRALETEDIGEEDLAKFNNKGDYDLEVLIHVAEKGVAVFGHVDIYFDNKVLSYGTYDEATYRLGGLISDGVLIEIDNKDDYIDFSQEHLGKTLFGFGLKLNGIQKERVRSQISKIYENLYEWKPLSKIEEEKGIVLKKPREDYASIVYNRLRAKFYKFKEGPFKTYFGLNTNCVLLADSIVGQAGIDIIKIQGLISPGAYFEYFNKEFLRKNSFVISRTIYYRSKDDKLIRIED